MKEAVNAAQRDHDWIYTVLTAMIILLRKLREGVRKQ